MRIGTVLQFGIQHAFLYLDLRGLKCIILHFFVKPGHWIRNHLFHDRVKWPIFLNGSIMAKIYCTGSSLFFNLGHNMPFSTWDDMQKSFIFGQTWTLVRNHFYHDRIKWALCFEWQCHVVFPPVNVARITPISSHIRRCILFFTTVSSRLQERTYGGLMALNGSLS